MDAIGKAGACRVVPSNDDPPPQRRRHHRAGPAAGTTPFGAALSWRMTSVSRLR
jgi:hypothetical protein